VVEKNGVTTPTFLSPSRTISPFFLSSHLVKKVGYFCCLYCLYCLSLSLYLHYTANKTTSPLHPIEITAFVYLSWFQKNSLLLLIALVY
jgi:hypothetical protein